MNKNLTKWNLTLAVVLASAFTLQAADTLRYQAQPRGSKVSIDGTSSIHDWTVEGAVIGGFFEAAAAFKDDKSLKTAMEPAPKAEVVIPIRSLKSGKETMDGIMQDAMKMKENPVIKYKLAEIKIKGEVPVSGTPVKFDSKGDLTVAGVTKPCAMEVTMERADDGKLKFIGTTPIKMTDFEIKPPAPAIAGGLIKTGDDVTIKFEWVVAPKAQ